MSLTVLGGTSAIPAYRNLANTFSALQTFAAGLTVSVGVATLLATTCTTLAVSSSAAITGAAATARPINLQTAGVNRFTVRLDATAEAGSDAGSLFQILAWTDAGAFIDTPVQITRAAGGAIALSRPLTCPSLTASSSIGVSGNSPGAYISLGITNASATGYAQINLNSGTLAGALNVATGLFYKFYQNGSVPWQWESSSGVVASLSSTGTLVLGTDPGGSEILRGGGGFRFNASSVIGASTGWKYLIVGGGNSASSDGFSIRFQTGGTDLFQIGNKSAVLGTAYDAQPYTYTAGASMQFSNGVQFLGASAAAGAIWKGAADGLNVRGVTGSVYDLVLVNAAGTVNILSVPTGTSNAIFGGTLLSSGATSGVGYSTGAGGTVAQITSRTTGVTLNKVCGQITLVSAAGSATWQSFTVTNSTVAATDTVRVCQVSGTDLYMTDVTAVAAGSFRISFATTGGTTTETPVFNFAVMKSVNA